MGDNQGRDRPGLDGTSGDGSVQITPEMIEAGLFVFWGFDRDADSLDEFMRELYSAMSKAAPAPVLSTSLGR